LAATHAIRTYWLKRQSPAFTSRQASHALEVPTLEIPGRRHSQIDGRRLYLRQMRRLVGGHMSINPDRRAASNKRARHWTTGFRATAASPASHSPPTEHRPSSNSKANSAGQSSTRQINNRRAFGPAVIPGQANGRVFSLARICTLAAGSTRRTRVPAGVPPSRQCRMVLPPGGPPGPGGRARDARSDAPAHAQYKLVIVRGLFRHGTVVRRTHSSPESPALQKPHRRNATGNARVITVGQMPA